MTVRPLSIAFISSITIFSSSCLSFILICSIGILFCSPLSEKWFVCNKWVMKLESEFFVNFFCCECAPCFSRPRSLYAPIRILLGSKYNSNVIKFVVKTAWLLKRFILKD